MLKVTLSAKFDQLDAGNKAMQAERSRLHLAQQPFIKDRIIDLLQTNNNASYVQLESSINNWCSAETIRRWVTSRPGYKLYRERIVPLLSHEQQHLHYNFAQRFCNNWGLGPGKYLLIMFDEKWFWGMVTRNTAKSFEGIEKNTLSAYHKSHINKVMGVAFLELPFKILSKTVAKGLNLNFSGRRYQK